LEERKKELVAERNRLQKLKKDNRSRMDAESREEGELAKVRLRRQIYIIFLI
jgi:hypothetical protein